MFHAQCPGPSLSRDTFSRCHGYDKFVVTLGPYTIHYQGDRPSHRWTLIDVAPRNHAPGYLTSPPELCQILCLNVRRRCVISFYQKSHSFARSLAYAADETKLCRLSPFAKQHRKSFSEPPAVSQDLSTRHDWSIKKSHCRFANQYERKFETHFW